MTEFSERPYVAIRLARAGKTVLVRRHGRPDLVLRRYEEPPARRKVGFREYLGLLTH